MNENVKCERTNFIFIDFLRHGFLFYTTSYILMLSHKSRLCKNMGKKVSSFLLSAVGAVHKAGAERCEHRSSRLKGEDFPEPHDRRAGHQQQTVPQGHTFTPGI